MRQFSAFKAKHPDKILFFRMGDFYEMFGDDAVKAAPILGIALTSRSSGPAGKIPLAGVPYHSVDKYLVKLLSAGEKVVIVEQVEDPKHAKGIVKRDIVEIITPATATVEDGVESVTPTWLVALYQNKSRTLGMAALDFATGSFVVDQSSPEQIAERVRVLQPRELLHSDEQSSTDLSKEYGILRTPDCQLTPFGNWNFDYRTAERELTQLFGTSTLDGFGLSEHKLAITAAGAIVRYLKENHRDRLSHINRLSRLDVRDEMQLDYSTVRNLELVRNTATSTVEHSLFSVVNCCQTASGARRLHQALVRPFRNKTAIELRQGGVAELVKNRELCYAVRKETELLGDLERLSGRLGIGKLSPRQMAAVRSSLAIGQRLVAILSDARSPHLIKLAGSIPDCGEIIQRLQTALCDEPPLTANRGNIIKRGHSPELDDLNDSIRDARTYIASLQKKERERTRIASLKVGFNKVFGYYIEITHSNLDSVPGDYIRKQTLVNAERYITPELKEKEELIANAEEKIFALEADLYAELMEYLVSRIADIMLTAELLAELDLVVALAETAVKHRFSRPVLYEDTRLIIRGGRHPVVESVLASGSFVANDLVLSDDLSRIHILTGPNMSGKSTYLRQIGLIVILAQIGSFVPAESAEIGLVDRVFTRVGAVDNLARGQSTFLVEMVEAANILNNATERSLLLLDEVGRGTSTFDGLSVAWAVVEHINDQIKARTIFATHYHELTSMASLYDSIENYQVAVKRWEDQVVFLHQIVEGGCDDSYGIEVARLAGIPRSTVSRARQILRLLESGKFTQRELGESIYKEKVQPTLFDPKPSAVEQRLKELDMDQMTPLDALVLLQSLKKDMS
ncbi:MAG: DNA mismatch repair protein MutS [Candidatus Zixiibacteriota bacterium]